MKSVVILYAAEISGHALEKVFDGKSAFELVLEWSKNVPGAEQTVVFASKSNEEKLKSALASSKSGVKIISKTLWTKGGFISEIAKVLQDEKADYAVVSYADTPFLNQNLTHEICETHEKYQAEYTFSDGYPYGLSPETIDKGSAAILSTILETQHKEKSDEKMSRDAIFSCLSIDINQFEIETVIAQKDYRLLRLEFECSSKINFLASKNLFEIEKNENIKDISSLDLISLCDDASSSEKVIKTVPAFYNIQISEKYNHNLIYEPKNSDILKQLHNDKNAAEINENNSLKCDDFDKFNHHNNMNFLHFKNLLKKISDLSEKAVISLSSFGEPLFHPQFFDFVSEALKYDDFSLLIETDGTLLSQDLTEKISQIENSKDRINWIVLLDAMDKNLYAKIHSCDENDFEKAVNSVQLLEKYFPNHVYPQFVRMKVNENELETFYRFWKNPDSPSHGKFIIQKYNNFCGLLPDEKPADLSPLERNPCWHLRRDMTILADGSVVECINQFNQKDKILGNAFTDDLEEIWRKFDGNLKNQICKKYYGLCKDCDEHYTFNF